MIHPSRIDGEPLRVVTLPDGRVFVDTEPEYSKWYVDEDGTPDKISRGGPGHSRHFHRFDDYGLAGGVLRCAKCGLVAKAGTPNSDSGKEING